MHINRRQGGVTLLELLVVIGIVGVITGLGIGGWMRMNQSLAFSGYSNDVAISLQQATAQSNTNNRLSVFIFESTGFRWGPASDTLTKSQCEAAANAPLPTETVRSSSIPVGVTGPSGWLCLAPTGIVSRLVNLETCTYGNGASAVSAVPCLIYRKGTARRYVLVSVSGQAIVQ